VQEQFLKINTFVLEPRWHLWLLLFKMLLAGDPLGRSWSQHLFRHLSGLACGVLYVVRYPRVWRKIGDYLARPGFVRYLGLIFLYFVAVCYLPITQ
jgi:hypothetical protein